MILFCNTLQKQTCGMNVIANQTYNIKQED